MKSAFKQATLLTWLLLVALVAVNAKFFVGTNPPDLFQKINFGKDIRHRRETVFNVLSFGAKPDGKKDNTQSFMKTWVAACHSKGAARVVIPGGTFLISQIVFAGPCASTSPIVVQIDATLKGDIDLSNYVSNEWILFEKINGLIITGRGTLDGQGDAVWKYNDCGMNPTCQKLPVNLKFNGITNVFMKGISSINSKGFHMFITNSENVRLKKLHITAPDDSPNTDGIHLSRSNKVKISRSVISTGDDCISLGRGSMNVTINKITCGPGHGISVGSLGKYENEEDVLGVVIKNCTLIKTDNGLRIKTWPDSPPSAASGILFQDINMIDVKNPILIDQEYSCSKTNCQRPPSRVKISDVHFINVKGSTISSVAVHLKCSKRFPCQNIELFNINLKYSGPPKKSLPFVSTCTNAKVGYRGVQFPPPCK
ncbi:exopolygalacturonase-like [Cucurbita pepo subsp. pepo]|uniref:exopolygalacturonase-like n=1 Tax=Cucurbita pepo subsp. pepo TaxID=3664 RepID=UPI000C9D7755|nr:exopolygalacturonase-like [Cucurbita pepo subsp. pepo]